MRFCSMFAFWRRSQHGRSNWQDGRDFLQTLSKRYESRVTEGRTDADGRTDGRTDGHMGESVTPAFHPAARPARDDVMSCMQELLPGFWPSSQRTSANDGRGRSVGRMTIYNAYYHILVGRDLSRAEQSRERGRASAAVSGKNPPC